MEAKPLRLTINGREHEFTYEETEVHLYRVFTDHPFNHIRTVEFGSQVVHLFNAPRIMTYLSGMPVDGHGLEKKELKQVCEDMDNQYGWNSRVIIEDYAPEDVKERYINLAATAVRQSVVVFPKEWAGGA